MENNIYKEKIIWIKRIRTTNFYLIKHLPDQNEQVKSNDISKTYYDTTIINSDQIVRIYQNPFTSSINQAVIELTDGKKLLIDASVDEIVQLL